jgi:hypothetical protein
MTGVLTCWAVQAEPSSEKKERKSKKKARIPAGKITHGW